MDDEHPLVCRGILDLKTFVKSSKLEPPFPDESKPVFPGQLEPACLLLKYWGVIL